MKITDEETDRAFELKWLIDSILFERERAVLYREVYVGAQEKGGGSDNAAKAARIAVDHMELAFEGISGAESQESERGSQAKAN
jgi:hypothetical protein